ATAASSSQINLSWTDNSNNETGFKLEWSLNGSTWNQGATVGANVVTSTSSGLTKSTKYYYRARAYNSGGNSAYSNTASATTAPAATPTPTPTPTPTATPTPTPAPTPTPTPAAPTNLTATAASSSQINLSWTDNSSNETGFYVERSTDGATFTQVGSVGANIKVYTSSGLAASTKYSYRARAYNPGGNSAYSSTWSARTAPAATPTPTPTPAPTPTPTPAAPTNLT